MKYGVDNLENSQDVRAEKVGHILSLKKERETTKGSLKPSCSIKKPRIMTVRTGKSP